MVAISNQSIVTILIRLVKAMIEAFVERIQNPSVVVRVGEGTNEDGRSYLRSVFGEVIASGHVILKGYDRELDTKYFRAAMRALFEDGFRVAQFDRRKGRRRTVFVTLCKVGVLSSHTIFHPA